jgi:heterotetrameric sarcosine oxidase delta subunit
MFRLPCPHCGLRNVSEFRHVGERRTRPDTRTATPAQWRAYLYEQGNVAGWSEESWYHTVGCRRFVSVERNTVTNEVRPSSSVPSSGQPAAGSTSADSGAPDAGSTS